MTDGAEKANRVVIRVKCGILMGIFFTHRDTNKHYPYPLSCDSGAGLDGLAVVQPVDV